MVKIWEDNVSLLVLWLYISTITNCVQARYECLCSLKVNVPIYDQPNLNANVIGYLFNDECKPTYNVNRYNGYVEIGHRHKLGYVETNANLTIQTCQGQVPVYDKVTTIPPTTTIITTTTLVTIPPTTPKPTPTTPTPTTTTTSSKSTTTSSTPKPTTTSTTPVPATTITPTGTPVKALPEGHIELCPKYSKADVGRNHGFLGQYGGFCYEYVPYQTQWPNAESHCHQVSSGHLVTISRDDEQDYILRFLKSHKHTDEVWLGLSDKDAEGVWKWSSGANVTKTNFQKTYLSHSDKVHKLNDCIVLRSDGEWVDIPCGVSLALGFGLGEKRHYVCQYELQIRERNLNKSNIFSPSSAPNPMV